MPSASETRPADLSARLERFREYTRVLGREKPDFAHRLGDLAINFADGQWSPLSAAAARDAWLEFAADGEASGRWPTVNYYVSVPYCARECSFCMFFDEVATDPAKLERYLRQVCALGDFFEEALRRVPLTNSHMGGGSPSLFNERQLERACASLFRRARLDPEGEHTIEINPASTTPAKMSILRDAGFNRVSFGVQSLDPVVLRKNARSYQTPELTQSTIARAWAAGFREVNADLICGLHEGRAADFLDSFKRVCSMGPNMVTIYLNEPVHGYIRDQYAGDLAAFERHLESETAGLVAARAWAESQGWTTSYFNRAGAEFIKGPRVFAAKEAHHFEIHSQDQAMLSFGRNSTSYLPRGLRYNITELGDRPEDTGLQGRKFSLRDRVKHFALERFHQGQAVSEASTKSVFGVGLLETIGPDLAPLRELGALRETGEGLTLVAADRAELVANAMMLFAPELVGQRVSDMFEDPLVMNVAGLRLTLRLRYGPPGGARLTLDIPELPQDSLLLGRLRALLAPIEAEGLDLIQARAALASRIDAMLGRIKGDPGAPSAARRGESPEADRSRG